MFKDKSIKIAYERESQQEEEKKGGISSQNHYNEE
jgi:hypothetical protein